jgi:hypothetical protein
MPDTWKRFAEQYPDRIVGNDSGVTDQEESMGQAGAKASVQVCRVPGIGPSVNEALAGKLANRIQAKKKWGEKVKCAANLREPERFPVRVLYRTFIPSGRTPRDVDGAAAACKIALDALEDLGVLPDDDGAHVAAVTLEAPRRTPGTLATEIVLIESA